MNITIPATCIHISIRLSLSLIQKDIVLIYSFRSFRKLIRNAPLVLSISVLEINFQLKRPLMMLFIWIHRLRWRAQPSYVTYSRLKRLMGGTFVCDEKVFIEKDHSRVSYWIQLQFTSLYNVWALRRYVLQTDLKSYYLRFNGHLFLRILEQSIKRILHKKRNIFMVIHGNFN